MKRAAIGLAILGIAASVPATTLACEIPSSTSLRPTDNSLNDWLTGNLCMWQGTDPVDPQLAAGVDLLGFAVTHTETVASNPNHFWFLRLRGAPVNNRVYRLSFDQTATGGHVVDMDMSCARTGDPRACTLACYLDGQEANCAFSTVRAYSLPNGEWAIELSRQSTQLFFDATDTSDVTASVRQNNTVLDSTAPASGYSSTGYLGATAVLLKRFEARPLERGVELYWETGSELGTIGFHVRRGATDGPRVEERMLPGLLTSPVGARYSLVDPSGSPSTPYFLEEISTRGTLFYGPAAPGAAQAGPVEPMKRARPERTRSAPLLEPAASAPDGDSFVEVRREGLYRLSGAAGLWPRWGLQITHRGAPVTTFRSRGNVLFYAPAPDAPDRAADAYRVTRSGAPRPGRALASTSASRLPVRSFLSTVRAEEHHLIAAGAEAAYRFPWGYAFSGAAPARFEFELPDYLGGPVSLTLNLLGLSDFPQVLDHHAVVAVNGAPGLDATFGGTGPVSYTLTVPDGVLEPGTNSITLAAVADLGVPYDLIALSSIEATYPRAYVARGDELSFTAAPGELIEVTGFSAEPAVVDLTDPAEPALVVGAPFVSGNGVGVRFSAARGRGVRRYFAAVPATAQLRASRATEVPSGSADYVAIVGDGLSRELEPLLALRRAQGRSVLSVPVEALYDRFDHGHHGPAAIRSYLAQLSPAPREVLLVGKPSIDPRDDLGHGTPDLVPTAVVMTADLQTYAPSDAWLVAGPDGRTPFAAVGRLPVSTPAELSRWVDKLVAYERDGASPTGRALFVADDRDPATGVVDPFFQQQSDALAAELAPMQALKVYLPNQGKAELLAALAQAPDLVSYHGHASGTDWSRGLLSSADVAGLPAARPFFLITVDCWDGMFAMPTFAPLAQVLAQAPQGGAIAAFAAGSLVDKAHDPLVDRAIYPHLTDPTARTVGEVTWRAQASLARLVGPARDLVFVYNLIGDPATRLPLR